MSCLKFVLSLLLILSLYSIFYPRYAYAYLDPGTGSYIFQILIAALVGGMFAIKIFWKNIKAFFVKLFSGKKDDQQDQD